MPPFRYFLLDRKHPVREGSSAWDVLLPTSRRSARGGIDTVSEGAVTRGDYFTVVRIFLEEAPHHRLAGAMSRRLGRKVATGDLDFVDIYLEKHGQFYHPARVAAAAAERQVDFVVNAAASAAGRALIETDFANLRRLSMAFPYGFIPGVYQLGQSCSDSSRHRWTLFLGQWLEGYHEFHLQRSSSAEAVQMVVWDPLRGATALSSLQTAAVYRQAARILTAYFNPFTSEQIGAWHHAAGDFVLRLEPTVDLKLVTVRQYRPLFTGLTDDIETVFQTLLLFLLNMSVRMRVDRDGGTGDLLWSSEAAVSSTLRGFFDGLDLQVRHALLPRQLIPHFYKYMTALSIEELNDLLFSLAEKVVGDGTESDLIRRHLPAHACAVESAFSDAVQRPENHDFY